MTEIIKVERKEGIETVNARELHGFLEVGRDFSTWIKDRIEQYGFLENVDYAVSKSIPQNGGTAIEYHISLDMAKELSMVERNEKGRIARKYFIECEKKLNISNSVLLPLLEEMKIRLDRIESKQIAHAPAKKKKPAPKRAKIIKYYHDDEQSTANGLLIAAAPEMIDMIIHQYRWVKSLYDLYKIDERAHHDSDLIKTERGLRELIERAIGLTINEAIKAWEAEHK